MNDRYLFTMNRRKNECGEYVVKAWRNGRRYEKADYFTRNYYDALAMLTSVEKGMVHLIRTRNWR